MRFLGMKKCEFFIISFFLLVSTLGYCAAGEYSDYFDEVRYFHKYNPDGIKYKFVKDYLSALSYLKSSFVKDIGAATDGKGKKNEDKVKSSIKKLTQDNVNFRIAKNFLDEYKHADNGLIVKVVDLFIQVCDEQIDINKRERQFIERLYEARQSQEPDMFNKREFIDEQLKLSKERRASWQDLLKASMLVKKVLISDTPDEFGEFVSLGITESQRQKLLNRLKEFGCKDCYGKMRAGQTFLDASIAAIREILEDTTWDTLPEDTVLNMR